MSTPASDRKGSTMPENAEREIPTGLDLRWNEKPICPYCGATQEDAWELRGEFPGDGESGTTDCGECEREFHWTRNLSVTYDTETMEAADAPGGSA